MKKLTAWLLALGLCAALAGCSVLEKPVYVQSVARLAEMGGIGSVDRFSGIVISESVTEIQRDREKTIDAIFVRVGDEVREGQKLFAYDTEQIQLTLEKQQLQLEQLQASIENYTQEIEKLQAERERANSKDKLQYTVQIQTNQIDLKEAELNLKTKQSEIQKSMHVLENAVLTSPVTGRVTAISENGTDNNGNELPYITIQKAGSYRVKGSLNEMQRGALMEGDRVRMDSRVDANSFWTGTIYLVDYENPAQNSGNSYYSSSDEYSSSSKYPFYIELDSSEGLLLGQHVYISRDSGEMLPGGVTLGSAFLCYDEEGNAYVWADNHGKLEKRIVELGEYYGLADVYGIMNGLDESDYIAFPDESVCVPGAPTTRTQSGREGGISE